MVHWDGFTDRFAGFLRNTDRCSRFNDSDTLANHFFTLYTQSWNFHSGTDCTLLIPPATDFYSTNIKYYKHSLERFHIFLPLSLCTPQRSFLPNKNIFFSCKIEFYAYFIHVVAVQLVKR
ncbi:hypothetical protein T07_11275 [Trichinella nelsoni]|uniref:Uncharacterized protein n=1 Tax=Trichinella nelsoni TaxID=6336 RepID=A0A0V0RTG8_9BILA|nr:hypothetical protein T07_11275 [Trichinella nelsoni]